VRILKGPFAHRVGLYYGMKPHERIEVPLSLLGGSQRVTLPASDERARLPDDDVAFYLAAANQLPPRERPEFQERVAEILRAS